MKQIHCLNCGTDFEGNYCPECGQSADVKRLTFRGVFIESAWDIVSLDSGMFYTLYMLVTKPWKVISEYIHGRRASYTKPVQLVLVTFVLVALVRSIPGLSTINSSFSDVAAQQTTHSGLLGMLWDYARLYFRDSEITQEFVSSLIAAATCWLVYLPFGSRRFNLVEYCCAYFYWSAMASTINIICAPLNLIHETLFTYVSFFWLIGMSATIVFRAFPIRRRWLRISMFCIVGIVFFTLMTIVAISVVGTDALMKAVGAEELMESVANL